jgi:hypothetical protein
MLPQIQDYRLNRKECSYYGEGNSGTKQVLLIKTRYHHNNDRDQRKEECDQQNTKAPTQAGFQTQFGHD